MGNLTVGQIEDCTLSRALSERYLAYAMSTIMSRSLPDVRDGLKPVHRRLLYAMYELKLNPENGFKKCARVVGDVIGKFHPHGDASVYDALVRLAQTFAARYPLVEGQGNFGSVDGDGAAAMRYTESRLTSTAMLMLEGLGSNAVDLRPTYDNEDREPVVLPSLFPNLLANGIAGIAVGMATRIPPHNAAELYRAAQKLIEKPEITIQGLVKYIQGPDFPTGGVLITPKEEMVEAYALGQGTFTVRAKWNVEKKTKKNWKIVVTELPYAVQKSALIQKIADLILQRKVSFLEDIQDESTTDIRIILEPKSAELDPEQVMERLFQLTDLESRFNLNMNVLENGKLPRVMSLKEVLQAWIDHVHEGLIRRSSYRLDAVNRRIEILEGFLKLFLNLDEVIRIIREEDEPKKVMIQTFKLTDLQAEYILNMRLRSLRRLEEFQIREEHAVLLGEKGELEKLLASDQLRLEHVSKDFLELEKRFKKRKEDKRLTLIETAPEDLDLSGLEEIDKEPITVSFSAEGWVRAFKGHGLDTSSWSFKGGDTNAFSIEIQNTDKFFLFDSSGRVFTIAASDLPGGKGFGVPVRTLIDLHVDSSVIGILPFYTETQEILFVSDNARGMIVAADALGSEKRTGRQVFNPDKGHSLSYIFEITDENHILFLSKAGNMLIFPLNQIPKMQRGKGVSLQKTRGALIKAIKLFNLEKGLVWKDKKSPKMEKNLKLWIANRGQQGRRSPDWI
ncbi:DNA topoisomerase IV subunit A [Acetobacteraceae bacterium]|nr:DNA topoisomerase IV subunit A [Acetobacteraceae bacterium]